MALIESFHSVSTVGPYRRQLQRGYLTHAEELLGNEELAASDVPGALRGQLRTLRDEAQARR